MSRSGIHTWDLHLEYHACPHCGFINESRAPFHKINNKLEKTLTCSRCKKVWIEERKSKKGFSGLFGEDPKPEFSWENTP